MSIVYKGKSGTISIHNLIKTLSPEKDDLSEFKRVTFMLFSMCDFLAMICNVTFSLLFRE